MKTFRDKEARRKFFELLEGIDDPHLKSEFSATVKKIAAELIVSRKKLDSYYLTKKDIQLIYQEIMNKYEHSNRP